MDPILLDHIAIALPRIADAPPDLMVSWGVFRSTPSRGTGFLRRFLASQGPGVHHVTFKVPSLAAACERAAGARLGIRLYPV
ncbi:MAG TPA: hypothetical protein VJX92_17220 [Methylomirabilota bacterium]|nr:hypothetical protein [Methylomirabilota bacterium]